VGYRVPRLAVFAALACSIGLHWVFLQSVAWVGMVVNYSHNGTFGEALGKTFDGKHPCSMCLKIRKGWHEEKQREAQLPLIKMEKMSEALWEFRCLKIPAAPTFALCEQLFVAALYTDFIDSTPTPPPRFVFCVL